jgi:hypothetical protein
MGWGDRFRAWWGGPAPAGAAQASTSRQVVFSEVPQPVLPVDQLLAYYWSKTGKIGRSQALSVPAVRRGRNMICAISTLPLEAVNEDNRIQRRPLFAQLDSHTANCVVLAQTIEDLFFDAVAWWRVVGFDAEGYPSRIRRYDVGTVSLQPPDDYQAGLLPSGMATEGVVWMEGHAVPFSEVIRFDSPNPGLLTDDPDVVRRAIALGQAAALYANSPRRRGYFRPVEGVDPAKDEAIRQILTDWHTASQERVDGYVPAALEYNAIQDSTPAELQLVQMQQQVVLDLANMLGIDPEDLGANTTSRTYQNATDRRRDRINETLAPYMSAITDRLGMPDVTPEGQRVRFRLDDYLKADPKTRAEVQQIYHNMGATDAVEIREEEGRPPRTITPPAAASSGAQTPAVLSPRRVPSSLGAEA